MKKIRKILPVSLYDIPGTERWLEQMANEGLFPAKLGNLGSRRAVFVPNGVPGTRFRIEPGRRDDGNDPYHVNQGGSGTSGESSLDLYYYLARSGHGAEDQLDALQEYATSGKDLTALPAGLPFQRADIPGAEEFLYRREDTQWEVLARREDRVLSLTYDGNLDLEDWFGDIAAMLTPTGP